MNWPSIRPRQYKHPTLLNGERTQNYNVNMPCLSMIHPQARETVLAMLGGGGGRATYTPFLPCDITNGHPFPSWSKKTNIPHKKMVRQVNSDEKDLRNLPAPSRF